MIWMRELVVVEGIWYECMRTENRTESTAYDLCITAVTVAETYTLA